MESSAGKLYEIGLSTQPQLEKLEGRQGEKEAVQGWSASVQRERMMRNKLKAAEKDVNEWKAKAGKHAATATGHAIDAEDILAESYTFLSNVRGVAILLPDGEAKAMLNRVLEQHERKILTWPEQGVPLAKQHVPTVELADVSNCLAGMSLANTHETQKFNTQSVDTSALDVQTFVPGKQGVFISPMMKQKENQIPQQCGVGPIKPASVSKETRIALGGNAASPSSDKGPVLSINPLITKTHTGLPAPADDKTFDTTPPKNPFCFAASDKRAETLAKVRRRGEQRARGKWSRTTVYQVLS